MPAHVEPREASFFVETTLAETQSDWPNSGTPIYVIEPDVSGVTQANLDNANIKPRRQAVHSKIRGLKSESTFSCGIYMHAKGSNAAEAAAATTSPQATLLKACFGGRDLGYAIGLAGGSASAPELDADPGYVAGDFVFVYDDSAGVGAFNRIESVDGGPPVVPTMLEDLRVNIAGVSTAVTPAADDVFHAVIDVYPLEDALNNHDDSDHDTLGWLVQGEHSEDVYVLQGCKPSLGEVSITAGEPVVLQLEHGVVKHLTAQSAETLTGTPSGNAPNVPGTGSSCSVRLAVFGAGLAEVDARGTLTWRPNISHSMVNGPNGCEGVHGYVAEELGTSEIELVVEFDNAYDTAWDNESKYHLMVQVGDTPATAWALYFPRLEFVGKPVRVDEGGVTSHRLVFRAMEDTASISGLTGDDIAKRRAPWHLLIAA